MLDTRKIKIKEEKGSANSNTLPPNADELLQFALERANLSLGDMQAEYEMTRKQNIINSHPYAISQGRDGRYRTYVYDSTRPKERRQLVRTTYEALCDVIYENAMETETKETKSKSNYANMTFIDFFYVWIKYKNSCTRRPTTVRKIFYDADRYYFKCNLSLPYLNIKMKDFNKAILKEWIHTLSYSLKLDSKQYNAMRLIPKQMFEYLCDMDVLDRNPISGVRVDSRNLKPIIKPKSETQVYYDDEIALVVPKSLELFQEKKQPLLLIIPLLLQTGLRIGEMMALEFKDIHEDYIHVHQIQALKCDFAETKMISDGFEIVDTLKNNGDERTVFLTPEAKEYIQLLKDYYASINYVPTYLFDNEKGSFILVPSADRRIRGICKMVGITEKSAHKSRKTFVSKLMDGSISLNYIREQVGHRDEKTTLNSYGFTSERDEDIQKKSVDILSTRKSTEKC